MGLYLAPPRHAVVLSVDEKSQIQALDRTQPGLPLKPGKAGTMTHDYIRHGTTTLFAALNVLDGTVLGRCMQRHRHQEFIRFLNAVEAAVPAGKLVHAILDNYATHKHPKVRAWLDRHERWTFHYTPDLRLLAECRRDLLLGHDPPPAAPRRLPLAGRPPGRHQPLPRRAQRRPQAVRLDRHARAHHGQAAASECVSALAGLFPWPPSFTGPMEAQGLQTTTGTDTGSSIATNETNRLIEALGMLTRTYRMTGPTIRPGTRVLIA